MERAEPTIKFEFNVTEINFILDCLLDRPARQSKPLIDRITAEATNQIAAAAEKGSQQEPE